MFADVCVINTPGLADFKLPRWSCWMRSWKAILIQASISTPQALRHTSTLTLASHGHKLEMACTYLSQRNFWCRWLRPEILALWRSPAAGVLKQTNKQTNEQKMPWGLELARPLQTWMILHCLSLSSTIVYKKEPFLVKFSWQKPKSSLCSELQLAQILSHILLHMSVISCHRAWKERPQEVYISTGPAHDFEFNQQVSSIKYLVGALCLPSSPAALVPSGLTWVYKRHLSLTATEILNKNDQYHLLNYSYPLHWHLLCSRKARVYNACWPGVKEFGGD